MVVLALFCTRKLIQIKETRTISIPKKVYPFLFCQGFCRFTIVIVLGKIVTISIILEILENVTIQI